jgi:hypothetical protein
MPIKDSGLTSLGTKKKVQIWKKRGGPCILEGRSDEGVIDEAPRLHKIPLHPSPPAPAPDAIMLRRPHPERGVSPSAKNHVGGVLEFDCRSPIGQIPVGRSGLEKRSGLGEAERERGVLTGTSRR